MHRKDILSDKPTKNSINKSTFGKSSKSNLNKKGFTNGTNGSIARRGNSK
jgi:hypothetical protein